jgi:hypothetical protein
MNSVILPPPAPVHNPSPSSSFLLETLVSERVRAESDMPLTPSNFGHRTQTRNIICLAMRAHPQVTGVVMWSENNRLGYTAYYAVAFSNWLPVLMATNGVCADPVRDCAHMQGVMALAAALAADYAVLGVLG